MEWYPWLNRVYCQILGAYRSGGGHHFLLFHSTKNNGINSLVYALSRWLMCLHPINIKSCNKCSSCCLMKSFSHPDYYVLKPDSEINSVGVGQIRVLVEKLYQYAYLAKLKIVYLEDSQWLTKEAENSLLKVFEEPPPKVYFFLICKNFRYVSSTLLSRCVSWTIYPPEEKIGVQWLYTKGIKNYTQALTGLRLSDGYPLEAYRVLSSDYWKLRLKLCDMLWKILDTNNFLDILPFFEENKIFISWLCSFLIDALKWHGGVYDFLVNMDRTDLVRVISAKYSILMLHHQLRQWLICLHYWENINYINKKFLLMYQLLNIEGNVVNFVDY